MPFCWHYVGDVIICRSIHCATVDIRHRRVLSFDRSSRTNNRWIVTLVCSRSFIDKVNKAIVDFVWNKKTPKIKISTMISSTENGAKKMPCFKTMVKTQKVMWVQRHSIKSDGEVEGAGSKTDEFG